MYVYVYISLVGVSLHGMPSSESPNVAEETDTDCNSVLLYVPSRW